jgi:mannosyltransferase OCH1-like enzyme
MILVILILCLIILLIIIENSKNKYENFVNSDQPYLWVYWENKDGKTTPSIIELCLEIMRLRLSNNFRMIKLDQHNIVEYIPEIKERKHILEKLIIAHRVDYYRVLLLNKYGGLYLDADIIVLNDLGDIIKKLEENDYIGFGCTGYRCTNGYGKPSNWAMGSKANGIMISRLKRHLENKLDNITEDKIEYHTFGKIAIWEILNQLIKNENYKYYHYDSESIGTRDIEGKWITNDMLVSKNKIKFKNEDKLYFIVFYNSDAEKILENYFINKTKEDLLNDTSNISYFIRKGYNI